MFNEIRFLTPPWEGSPPLLQEIWIPISEENKVSDHNAELVIRDIALGIGQVVQLENVHLQSYLYKRLGMPYLQTRLTRFPGPYTDKFAHGDNAINILHPLTESLLFLSCFLLQPENRRVIPIHELRTIDYLLSHVIGNMPGSILTNFEHWLLGVVELENIIQRLCIDSLHSIKRLSINYNEFIHYSCDQFLHINVREN